MLSTWWRIQVENNDKSYRQWGAAQEVDSLASSLFLRLLWKPSPLLKKEKKWSGAYRPSAGLWDVEVALVDLQARLSVPFH